MISEAAAARPPTGPDHGRGRRGALGLVAAVCLGLTSCAQVVDGQAEAASLPVPVTTHGTDRFLCGAPALRCPHHGTDGHGTPAQHGVGRDVDGIVVPTLAHPAYFDVDVDPHQR